MLEWYLKGYEIMLLDRQRSTGGVYAVAGSSAAGSESTWTNHIPLRSLYFFYYTHKQPQARLYTPLSRRTPWYAFILGGATIHAITQCPRYIHVLSLSFVMFSSPTMETITFGRLEPGTHLLELHDGRCHALFGN